VLELAQKADANPYADAVKRLTQDELIGDLNQTKEYFKDLAYSGRTVNDHGELTAEGKKRLTNAAFLLYAQVHALASTAPTETSQ
jgi:hypothetical protein